MPQQNVEQPAWAAAVTGIFDQVQERTDGVLKLQRLVLCAREAEQYVETTTDETGRGCERPGIKGPEGFPARPRERDRVNSFKMCGDGLGNAKQTKRNKLGQGGTQRSAVGRACLPVQS